MTTPDTHDLPEVDVEHDGEMLTLPRSRREAGTRYVFGKPMHYGRNSRGNLVLLPGHDPRTIEAEGLFS